MLPTRVQIAKRADLNPSNQIRLNPPLHIRPPSLSLSLKKSVRCHYLKTTTTATFFSEHWTHVPKTAWKTTREHYPSAEKVKRRRIDALRPYGDGYRRPESDVGRENPRPVQAPFQESVDDDVVVVWKRYE